MFLFLIGQTAVLLLVSTQGLVLASFKDEKKEPGDLAKVIVRSMQNPWIDGIYSMSRSSENSCDEEITMVSQAAFASEMWALQMLDASSKLQSGILQGNVRDLGMYDECIKVNGQYNDTNIQGKYCTVSFGILSSAVCVPSSCNERDVVEIVDAIIQNVTRINELEFGINSVTCMPLGPEDFTVGELSTIFFFSVIGVFIVFCTICEFVKKIRPVVSPVVNELAKFSLYTNTMAVLSTKVSPRMMPAVQGIRFLSMCWVVLGHRYVHTALRPMVNTLDIFDWYDSWSAVYIQAAPFAVDTFFVISGFLMTQSFLKSKQEGKRSNILMMYMHRYLRLTPAIAILILFVAVLLHRVTNGPLWNILIGLYVKPCQKNWWIDLLYLQNFVKANQSCLPHTWYLAVDMQLFWISPIILYPLYRWPKYGLGLLGLFLVASVVMPAVVLAVNGYTNAVLRFDGQKDTLLDNFTYFYIPTYNRACAYFVGILLGYYAATNEKRHLTQINVAINWIVAYILLLLSVLSTRRVYDSTLGYNLGLEISFAIFLRPFWSIAIAWIVYACTHGYGGVIAKFLSLPIFLPLSRLSYCIYLVHMVIQGVMTSAIRTSGRFTDFATLTDFCGDLILSIPIAFIFCLFFESPVIVLEKILTRGSSKPSLIPEPMKHVEEGVDNKGMMRP